jgi:hypothetical protein
MGTYLSLYAIETLMIVTCSRLFQVDFILFSVLHLKNTSTLPRGAIGH